MAPPLRKYTKTGYWSASETREFKNIIVDLDIPDELKGKKYADARKIFNIVSKELVHMGFPFRTEIELFKKYKEIRADYQQKLNVNSNQQYSNQQYSIFNRIYSYFFPPKSEIDNDKNVDNKSCNSFNVCEDISNSLSVTSELICNEKYYDINPESNRRPSNNNNELNNNLMDKYNIEEIIRSKMKNCNYNKLITTSVDKSTNVGLKTKLDTSSLYVLRNIDPDLGIYKLCTIDETLLSGKYEKYNKI